MTSARVPASFRDPSGFVYRKAGVLLRQVDAGFRDSWDRFVQSGLADELIAGRLLIAHEIAPLSDAASPNAIAVIKPRELPFISYPYEWAFSQLQDAALLTLDIQRRALAKGMTLRDASAYNIQFDGARPIFIDTLSFAPYHDGEPWGAYRQFCEHFLAPLALMAKRNVYLGKLHELSGDGIPLELASALLGRRGWLSGGLLLHVHLHARAQKRFAGAGTKATAARVSRASVERLIEQLRDTVSGLRYTPEGTTWADYERTHNYSDAARAEKERIVREMVARVAPVMLWDLGGNTGHFAEVAAPHAATVVAMDIDPAAVEVGYRARRGKDTNVQSLVVDLLAPSPPSGWDTAERRSLSQRGPADAALALALVHHLVLGGNVPLPFVASGLAKLARTLIIEFVPLEDPQAQRLVAARREPHHAYSQAAFEAAFAPHYRIAERVVVGDSGRTLYHLAPNA